MEKKILVILGATASGKSALAVKLAKKFNGEIISADSRQVYRGLDIGSGKITKKEMRGVPHYLLDIISPKNRFNVVKYQTLARRRVATILQRGQLPIICGGSGFYIKSVTDDIAIPDVPPNELLRARLQKETLETLLNILMKLDPIRGKTVDQKNRRRIIRAIEIAQAIGAVPALKKPAPTYKTLKISLDLSPEELKEKIAARLHARLKLGMIAEAKTLHKKGLSWKRMNELGLEYRYLAYYLQGKMTKLEMIAKLQTEIWRYAKRQMTWFKRDKQIQWFKPGDSKKIEVEVRKFLHKKSPELSSR